MKAGISIVALSLGLMSCEQAPTPPAAEPQRPVDTPAPRAWTYWTSENTVSKSKIRFAEIKSEPQQGMPQVDLTIREESGVGTEIFVSGTSFFCEISGETVSVKFDGGPTQQFPCKASTTGNAPSAFGFNNRRIIPQIAAADTMVVTAFGPARTVSFTFKPRGLDW